MFTVTLTNNTSVEFDTALASVSMQSGGRESEQIYDSENNMMGAPSVTLLPGKSVSFDVGFGVLDPADLVLELAPSFEHSGAIFVS